MPNDAPAIQALTAPELTRRIQLELLKTMLLSRHVPRMQATCQNDWYCALWMLTFYNYRRNPKVGSPHLPTASSPLPQMFLIAGYPFHGVIKTSNEFFSHAKYLAAQQNIGFRGFISEQKTKYPQWGSVVEQENLIVVPFPQGGLSEAFLRDTLSYYDSPILTFIQEERHQTPVKPIVIFHAENNRVYYHHPSAATDPMSITELQRKLIAFPFSFLVGDPFKQCSL